MGSSSSKQGKNNYPDGGSFKKISKPDAYNHLYNHVSQQYEFKDSYNHLSYNDFSKSTVKPSSTSLNKHSHSIICKDCNSSHINSNLGKLSAHCKLYNESSQTNRKGRIVQSNAKDILFYKGGNDFENNTLKTISTESEKSISTYQSPLKVLTKENKTLETVSSQSEKLISTHQSPEVQSNAKDSYFYKEANDFEDKTVCKPSNTSLNKYSHSIICKDCNSSHINSNLGKLSAHCKLYNESSQTNRRGTIDVQSNAKDILFYEGENNFENNTLKTISTESEKSISIHQSPLKVLTKENKTLETVSSQSEKLISTHQSPEVQSNAKDSYFYKEANDFEDKTVCKPSNTNLNKHSHSIICKDCNSSHINSNLGKLSAHCKLYNESSQTNRRGTIDVQSNAKDILFYEGENNFENNTLKRVFTESEKSISTYQSPLKVLTKENKTLETVSSQSEKLISTHQSPEVQSNAKDSYFYKEANDFEDKTVCKPSNTSLNKYSHSIICKDCNSSHINSNLGKLSAHCKLYNESSQTNRRGTIDVQSNTKDILFYEGENNFENNTFKRVFTESEKSISTYQSPLKVLTKDNFALMWFSWKNEFLTYMKSADQAENDKEKWGMMLLNRVGPIGQEIYRTFTFDNDHEKEDINILLNKFDHYCAFENRKKSTDEDIDIYMNNLKVMALQYTSNVDEIVKKKILEGIDIDKFTNNARNLIPNFTFSVYIKSLTVQEITCIWMRSENINFVKTEKIDGNLVKNCSKCSFTHKINKCHACGKYCSECGDMDHHWKRCPSNFKNNCPYCGESHFYRECLAYMNECSRCHRPNHFYWKCGFVKKVLKCRHCDTLHIASTSACPAINNVCVECGKRGHFSSKCGENIFYNKT
ncbi:uncharacterized protein LOC105189419 [Harpegnathos saltator]|uniref:uncharacterized protein LOC105189419 n=1 Tax=Harpegnathos saltator TaxID=610380 RepID=UPI000DBED85A|nr:uncharacterized protein LOC105189419 [Harpegnathos saltator]